MPHPSVPSQGGMPGFPQSAQQPSMTSNPNQGIPQQEGTPGFNHGTTQPSFHGNHLPAKLLVFLPHNHGRESVTDLVHRRYAARRLSKIFVGTVAQPVSGNTNRSLKHHVNSKEQVI